MTLILGVYDVTKKYCGANICGSFLDLHCIKVIKLRRINANQFELKNYFR